MTAKLDWNYDDALGEDVAHVTPTLRVRAPHDDSPQNPFEDWDGHWPMMIYSDRSITTYDNVEGITPGQPLGRFSDQLLVFCQKQLADILSEDPNDSLDVDEARKWHTDADFLRECFDRGWDSVVERSNMLSVCEQLYDLLGIPCLRTTSTGYSQGDWAEVLVVATPEAQKEFGVAEPPTPESLQSQVDLYGAWAWGDVYGYIIEKAMPAPAENDADGCCVECGRDNAGHPNEPCLYEGGNGEDCPMYDDGGNVEWEEISDGSCWGYYGAEHDESGLEDAAMEVVNAHLSRVAVKEAA